MFNIKYSVPAYLGVLLTLVVIGSLVKSENAIMPALGGQSTQTTVQKAEALNKDEKYDASLELLLGAVNDQPSNNVLKSLLKKTFVLQLQSRIADGYDRIAKDKHDIDGYLAISKAYNLVEDHFRAMEVLTTGAIENPKSVRLWLSIGLLELEQNRDAEALSVFREVLNLDASNAHAYNNIAFVESRTEDTRIYDLKDAQKKAEKAIKLDPKNANFLDTLAEINFKLGERREAVRLIKRAISLDPEEPFYQSQLGHFENDSNEEMSRDTAPGIAK